MTVFGRKKAKWRTYMEYPYIRLLVAKVLTHWLLNASDTWKSVKLFIVACGFCFGRNVNKLECNERCLQFAFIVTNIN